MIEGIKTRAKRFKQNTQTRALMLMGRVGLYWWDGKVNFGDLIARDIFSHFEIPYVYARPALANAVSSGSLLGHLPDDYSGSIVGTGFLQDGPPIDFKNASVWAVRGELSKSRIEGHQVDVLLDPGLLVDQMYNFNKTKDYELGIIPHYKDKGDKLVQKWIKKYPSRVNIIDVQNEPKHVISEIGSCKYVVSSSLHGIVSSHSLGIPCAWAKISEKLKGGSYKFDDYFSVFGRKPNQVLLHRQKTINALSEHLWRPSDKEMRKIKKNLNEVYCEAFGLADINRFSTEK